MKTRLMQAALCGCAALALAGSAGAQSTATPIKAGLWETTATTSMQMQLPPEVQARIAALPPDQQAMLKANMGGTMGGAPAPVTTRSCSTGQSVQDLMNQAQQRGSECKLTNQTQTANGMSFDMSCTTPQGTATGHSTMTMADSSHVTGETHLTVNAKGRNGAPSAMTLDSKLSSKYLGADCGDVKPNSSVVMK